MKRYAREVFDGQEIWIRDNAVNLVLGYRKLTIGGSKTAGKVLGKHSFLLRTSERVWLEAMQFMRIKVALLTPEVATTPTPVSSPW